MASLRVMADEELPAVLSLLAASGSTARTVESWRQDRMTALVLGEKGNATAVMPLSRRVVQASPGRALNVGWLSSNQFAGRMSLRRQTRETAGEWAGLLPELDALLMLRRDEASLSGRWYTQTGFHDVLSVRCLYLEMESAPVTRARGPAGRYQVHVATPSEATTWNAERWQGQMAGVYQEVYASCGGARVRSAEFWAPALGHHYYREHYQFQIIGLWTAPPTAGDATLMGYAVVGWSGWHSKRPRMDILELATRQWDAAVAGELIQTTCQLAWSKSVRQVRAVVSVHDPYRGHLARSGFADRWGYLMLAKWLQAQRYLDRLGESLPAEMGDFAVMISSPGAVPLNLRRVGGKASPVHVQGDGRAVTRLLLNRLEVGAALGDGTLFAALQPTDAEAARLALAFPWTPWVFHMVDYI